MRHQSSYCMFFSYYIWSFEQIVLQQIVIEHIHFINPVNPHRVTNAFHMDFWWGGEASRQGVGMGELRGANKPPSYSWRPKYIPSRHFRIKKVI